MNIRAYTPDDFDTVAAWAQARDMTLIPQLLSPNGFLVEDDNGPLMVAFGYLMFDCPIVQIDNLLGRPLSDIKSIREALAIIQRAIIGWIKNINKTGGFDYRLIRCFVSPIMAGECAKIGWNVDSTALNCIRYVIH